MKKIRKILPELAKSLLLILATIWLFYDGAAVSWSLFLCLIPLIRIQEKKRKKEEKWKLNLAFKDFLLYLQNGLAAGYSPEESLKETKRAMILLYGSSHPINDHLYRMLTKMSTGISMEQALAEFGEECQVDDIIQFSELFSIVKRTGGSLVRVLQDTGGIIQEKIELKRETHTAIAAKKMEFLVMCVVPYGILLYLKLTSPAMIEGLYHNLFGVVFMSILLFFCVFFFFLGNHIIGKDV